MTSVQAAGVAWRGMQKGTGTGAVGSTVAQSAGNTAGAGMRTAAGAAGALQRPREQGCMCLCQTQPWTSSAPNLMR